MHYVRVKNTLFTGDADDLFKHRRIVTSVGDNTIHDAFKRIVECVQEINPLFDVALDKTEGENEFGRQYLYLRLILPESTTNQDLASSVLKR